MKQVINPVGLVMKIMDFVEEYAYELVVVLMMSFLVFLILLIIW